MLVLAFESEIDKLLNEHRGYITQSASALSNSHNPNLIHLAHNDKAKLHKLHTECHTTSEVAAFMCPGAGAADYPDHPDFETQYKYNLIPLLDAEHLHFDFRQQRGTLSADEILHWICFTGNLMELARRLPEAELLRLVHYDDDDDDDDDDQVSLTELFLMIVSWQPLTKELYSMMEFYSRKSMARGTR